MTSVISPISIDGIDGDSTTITQDESAVLYSSPLSSSRFSPPRSPYSPSSSPLRTSSQSPDLKPKLEYLAARAEEHRIYLDQNRLAAKVEAKRKEEEVKSLAEAKKKAIEDERAELEARVQLETKRKMMA